MGPHKGFGEGWAGIAKGSEKQEPRVYSILPWGTGTIRLHFSSCTIEQTANPAGRMLPRP
jgi:hypothetical protein